MWINSEKASWKELIKSCIVFITTPRVTKEIRMNGNIGYSVYKI